MLQQLLKESREYLEDDFYSNKFKFSYSSLCKLLYSPAVFYQVYILGYRENNNDKSLVEGKLIHRLLLEEETFHDHYIVSPNSIPKDRTKILVDTVFSKAEDILELDPGKEFKDFKEYILEVLKEIDYWQNLKTDEAKIDKVNTEEVKSYWSFLKSNKGKILIDQDTLSFCKRSVEIIKENKKASQLLGLDNIDKNIEVYNELEIESDIPLLPFGLKGILDNLKIDHKTKTIYINDFKTTSKSLKDFKDSIEYYSYWMQAIIYMIMVSGKWIGLLDKGYELKFHFIVIDKYLQVYSFPVSEATRSQWLSRFEQVMEQAEYHYKERRFELPYEFDKELVIL